MEFTEKQLSELADSLNGETLIGILLSHIARLSHDLGAARQSVHQLTSGGSKISNLVTNLQTENQRLKADLEALQHQTHIMQQTAMKDRERIACLMAENDQLCNGGPSSL